MGYCAKLAECFPGGSEGCVAECEGLIMTSSQECVGAYVAAGECVVGAPCESVWEGVCSQEFWKADMICAGGCEADFFSDGEFCEVMYTCGMSDYAIVCGPENCECYAFGDPFTTCSWNDLCGIAQIEALEYASACCGWVI